MKTHNRSFKQTEATTYTSLAPQTFSAACRVKLENLKNSLVRRFTSEFSDVQERLVQQAVDEANALASLTELPHLFLPTLAEEKEQSARQWNAQQQAILKRSSLAFAA
jgi:hypothetical protein